MAEKQKLIDLLEGFSFPVTVNGEMLSEWTIPMPQMRKALADHLLANGVTFATDTNVGSKWISVEDRLPDEGEVVMCYHKVYEYPVVCQWDESDLCWVNNDWTFGRGLITHWMPLPEAPKEGR